MKLLAHGGDAQHEIITDHGEAIYHVHKVNIYITETTFGHHHGQIVALHFQKEKT